MATDPFLLDAAIYLGAAVVAVPVSKRLGLGSVVGYLVAGSVIGPWGTGLISDAETVLHFAEFGVVLLLFVIGLELQPTRLWRLRTEIFGLGLLQVLVTGAALASIIAWFGWLPAKPAIAIGGALALSSTAFAVQILRERGDLTKPYGDRAFSILLFQDLAIVPLLALVSILSPWATASADGDPLTKAGIALAAIATLGVVGHYLLRPLFHLIAAAKADEIFTAAALLVVIGAAVAMQMVGLSMALGAFLAGVLLAESEFRHQLETDIEPFRGLLLGLLFIAVGMSVAWPLVAEHWTTVIFGALGMFALKSLLIWGLCTAFGSPQRDALRIAAVLGQGGEFGFVLFTVAAGAGLLVQRDAFILTAMVTLSMALTPFVMLLVDRLIARGAAPDMTGVDHVEKVAGGGVIIVGFGRFGQIVARVLKLRGYEVTLVEFEPGAHPHRPHLRRQGLFRRCPARRYPARRRRRAGQGDLPLRRRRRRDAARRQGAALALSAPADLRPRHGPGRRARAAQGRGRLRDPRDLRIEHRHGARGARPARRRRGGGRSHRRVPPPRRRAPALSERVRRARRLPEDARGVQSEGQLSRRRAPRATFSAARSTSMWTGCPVPALCAGPP